jgi:hypothetical protein
VPQNASAKRIIYSFRSDIIERRTDFVIKLMNKPLSYFTSYSPNFDAVWGSSFELRQEVSRKIKSYCDKQ